MAINFAITTKLYNMRLLLHKHTDVRTLLSDLFIQGLPWITGTRHSHIMFIMALCFWILWIFTINWLIIVNFPTDDPKDFFKCPSLTQVL